MYSALAKDGYVKDMFARFMGEEGAVYAVKEDLAERGLAEDNLPERVEVIKASDVKSKGSELLDYLKFVDKP